MQRFTAGSGVLHMDAHATFLGAILLLGLSACATPDDGQFNCRFDEGGLIAQLNRVEIEDPLNVPALQRPASVDAAVP